MTMEKGIVEYLLLCPSCVAEEESWHHPAGMA
jgi:hypothetical protein